jgi:DNA-binding NtrC family response regulator
VDVRIIAASNQDLRELVKQGTFREDLLYRLDVVRMTISPLRQRKQDIPLLVAHFLTKYSQEMNKRVLGVSNGAMRALLGHEWRGNVRELENVIERAVIFAEGREVGVEDLPFGAGAGASEPTGDVSGEELRSAVEEFERQHITASLRRHRYDKAETARCLGVGISSLYRKLEELNIPRNPQEPGAPTKGDQMSAAK